LADDVRVPTETGAAATGRSRANLITIVLLVAFVGGLALGWLQQVHIYESRVYCLGTEDIYQDAGPRFAALMVWITRVSFYGGALPFLAATALVLTRPWTIGRQAIAVAIFVSVLAGVLFVVDFAFFNGIESYAEYIGVPGTAADRCPFNQPPWWPNWIPTR
jgi:hypothetical protein